MQTKINAKISNETTGEGKVFRNHENRLVIIVKKAIPPAYMPMARFSETEINVLKYFAFLRLLKIVGSMG
jgi:hypothetical protein